MVHIPVHIEPRNRHHVYIARVKGVPGAAQLITMPQNSTRIPYQAVLPHAIDWSRGNRIAAARLGSAGGTRPAQTETIHVRVDRHESMQNTGRGRICADACKQSWRGALLVRYTYCWDPLAGAVGQGILRHQ